MLSKRTAMIREAWARVALVEATAELEAITALIRGREEYNRPRIRRRAIKIAHKASKRFEEYHQATLRREKAERALNALKLAAADRGLERAAKSVPSLNTPRDNCVDPAAPAMSAAQLALQELKRKMAELEVLARAEETAKAPAAPSTAPADFELTGDFAAAILAQLDQIIADE